jgi:pyruvate dehydrogenase E2 component (dihydrolipoamide acetyltransferase)
MSRLQAFPLPDVGEGLTEAEILEWKVAEGDNVEVNQILVEIETAKAAVELPSPHAGRVHRLLAEVGVTIEVGTPIIEIDTTPDAGPLDGGDAGAAATDAAVAHDSANGHDAAAGSAESTGAAAGSGAGTSAGGDAEGAKIGEAMADGRVQTLVGIIAAEGRSARRARVSGASPSTSSPSSAAAPSSTTPSATAGASAGAVAPEEAPEARDIVAPLATPPVRKLAKDLGIDLHDVAPSRADGVISRGDVEAVAAAAQPAAASYPGAPTGGTVAYDPASREWREPIKGVRKMMAQAMVDSAFTAPHVTEFLSVDVTPMMKLRERLRARRDWAGVKLSPLTFAARAVCLAARRTPEVNCTWDDDAGEVIFKEYVHLGIAAATARGLIVPVIRDADQLDLRGLADSLTELTETARAGRTTPADMVGGTFTITNVGVLGVDTGTPIINPGQSAILALGSVKDAPWVVNGKLKVRKVCQLALSFDHRVVDGEKGSQFLADVGALMADRALAITY